MGETGGGLAWTRCFLCSSPVADEAGGGGGYGGGVKEQTVVDSVKLLMKYLLNDVKLEAPLTVSVIAQWSGGGGGGTLGGGDDFTPRLCTYCGSLVGSISKLQLELEVIQMKIVSGLAAVKKAVISNSRLYGGNDGVKQDFEELEERLLQVEANGGDCSSGRRFLDAIHHFQTFVFENDSKNLHIPLIYLEKYTGKRVNATLSTSLNLEQVAGLKTDNIKEEPEDYPEPMEEAETDFDFDELPVPLPEIKTEPPTATSRRGRKSAQLATARINIIKQSLKRPRKEPEKKVSQAQLLYRQIMREKYAKKWEGQKPVRQKKWEGRTRVKIVNAKPNFTCDECGLKLNHTTSFAMEQHLKEHETPSSAKRNNYECPDCKIPFKQQQYFEIHLSYHSYTRACEICSQRIPIAGQEAHLKTHQEKNFGCQFCSLWFPTFESLVKHLGSHPRVSVKCELCPEDDSTSYSVQTELRRHLSECHGKKERFEHKCPFDGCSEVFYTATALTLHRAVHRRVYTCSVCDKSFKTGTDLERHTRREHPTNVTVWYPCESCGLKFLTEAILLRHEILEHDKPKLKCHICSKEFLSKESLKGHRRHEHKIGKEPLKFVCSHCGKGPMRDKHTWRRHEESHTTEKNFTCEICGFASNTAKNLRRHMEVHDQTRERKYPCPHCPDRFYENDALQNHIRRHTGERPFQCDECGATFNQKSALNVHSKKHMKETGFVPRGPRATWKKKGRKTEGAQPHPSSLAQNCDGGMHLNTSQEGCQLPVEVPAPVVEVEPCSSSSLHELHIQDHLSSGLLPPGVSLDQSLHVKQDRSFL